LRAVRGLLPRPEYRRGSHPRHPRTGYTRPPPALRVHVALPRE
jgi:hypothetical protein